MEILINNLMINYKVSGEGYPIIFLHGWGLNLGEFDKVADQINEDFKVYQIDLPGFGKSEINKEITLDDYANMINEFCLSLAIIKPIIVGHSFGGRVGIVYASKYQIDKLILVCSPGVKQKFSLNKFLKIKVYKCFKRMKINLKMGSSDYKNSNDILKKILVSSVNRDLTDELKKIKCQTLLIYGQKDKSVPLYVGHKIKSLIKDSVIIEIPDCGHFPYRERFRYFLIVLKHYIYNRHLWYFIF